MRSLHAWTLVALLGGCTEGSEIAEHQAAEQGFQNVLRFAERLEYAELGPLVVDHSANAYIEFELQNYDGFTADLAVCLTGHVEFTVGELSAGSGSDRADRCSDLYRVNQIDSDGRFGRLVSVKGLPIRVVGYLEADLGGLHIENAGPVKSLFALRCPLDDCRCMRKDRCDTDQ
jgi:hypothetical protein